MRRRGEIRWLSQLVLTMLVIATGCGSSQATPSGGRIFYSGTVNHYFIDGNGTHPRKVVWPVTPSGVGLTGDGKRVAYTIPTDESGQLGGLFVAGVSDLKPNREIWKLADIPTASPVWNPAATRIALAIEPEINRGGELIKPVVSAGVWVVDADGHDPHLLVAGQCHSVSWSPDGTRVAYTTDPSKLPVTVMTVSVNGGRPRLVASYPGFGRDSSVSLSLSWSPDGRTILVDSVGSGTSGLIAGGLSEVRAFPSNGGPGRTLLAPSPQRIYDQAVYSPDGRRFAVVISPPPPPPLGPQNPDPVAHYGPSTLNVANANGSNLRPFKIGDSTVRTNGGLAWIQ